MNARRSVRLRTVALSRTAGNGVGPTEVRFKVGLKIPVRLRILFPTNECWEAQVTL